MEILRSFLDARRSSAPLDVYMRTYAGLWTASAYAKTFVFWVYRTSMSDDIFKTVTATVL